MDTDSTVRSMCTIGQEISIWCEKNHITNQELADALAVSRETVKRIKNGTRELTSKEIRRLSVLMEKPAEFFIPNDDDLEEDASIQIVKMKNAGQNAFSRAKEKAQKNNEMEKMLADAMETINGIVNVEKKRKICATDYSYGRHCKNGISGHLKKMLQMVVFYCPEIR